MRLSKWLLTGLLTANGLLAYSSPPKWVNLFNGKDLTGWKQVNGQARYTVENGELVGTSVANTPNSFLITEREYGDFLLELEFKIAPGINSGVQFRSQQRPGDGRVNGYQMEIDHSTRNWSGGIYDEARRGWLYGLDLNEAARKAYRPGEWNTYRIECIGSQIRTWVNGIPTAHILDNWTTKGLIGLQVHALYKPEDAGKQVRWRNIRIRTEGLKSAPPDAIYTVNLLPNQLSESEKAAGWKVLWDGKTTTGWRGVKEAAFPTKYWSMTNDALTVSPHDSVGKGNDLVTTESFGPGFDLRFEFNLSEGGNSGVKYFIDPAKSLNTGFEYQLIDDVRHPDAKNGKNGNRTMASLYDLIPSKKFEWAAAKPGQWNQGRIVAYPDGRVEHYLNNIQVLAFKRDDPAFRTLVADSKYATIKDFGLVPSGPILLQHHGDGVSFRSIRIKVIR